MSKALDGGIFKHSYKTRLRESFGLSVFNTGRQRCEPSYTWGPALRDHYLIHYVAQGKGRLFADGKTYEIGKGDAFLTLPGRLVSYSADAAQPWEYLWVGFHGSDAQSLLALTDFSAERPVLHPKDGKTVERLLAGIYDAVGPAAYQETRMSGHLYLFLAHLMEIAQTPRAGLGGAKGYADLAVRFVEYNYSARIGIEDIAAHVGISRSYLYRMFIEQFGLSPNDFLTQFRVNRACALLRGTELSVGEIAGSVGYDDPLYFSRVFKRVKGVSPSEYKHRL